MFDLREENDDGDDARYNWLTVRVAIIGFAIQVGFTFPGLKHDGVFVFTPKEVNPVECAEANRQMCVLCFALQTDLSPENCDEYNVVIALLTEEIQNYRSAMQQAVFHHLLSHLSGEHHEST